jgi:hypothetical protein
MTKTNAKLGWTNELMLAYYAFQRKPTKWRKFSFILSIYAWLIPKFYRAN